MSIALGKSNCLNSIILSLIATTTALSSSVLAADFSFRGTFSADDEVQMFDFNIETTSDVTLKTLSYAGGIQADGTDISAGGFDPILALFDGSGDFIDGNDDGIFPDVGIDPFTGEEFDTFLQTTLDPGNYTVAISQFDNFFNGGFGDNVSLGFFEEGNPNFTALFGCSNGQFCDVAGDNRTNEWAFDVLNVDSAVAVETPITEDIPEPSTVLALILAFGFGFTLKNSCDKQISL